MSAKHTKSVSLAMIESEADAVDDDVGDWIPRRGVWLGPATVLFAFLLGNFTGFLLDDALERRNDPKSPPVEPASADVATAEPPKVVPPPPAEAPSAPAVEARPPTEQPKTRSPKRRTPEPSPATALVEVELKTDPPGAWVSVDGVRYGRTPLTVLVPPSPASRFVFEKTGYQRATARWSAANGKRAVNTALVVKK